MNVNNGSYIHCAKSKIKNWQVSLLYEFTLGNNRQIGDKKNLMNVNNGSYIHCAKSKIKKLAGLAVV